MAWNTFMSHVQTRSGLGIMRDNLLAAMEVSPWSEKEFIRYNLEDFSEVIVPIFAIRYDWITPSKFLLVILSSHHG